MYVRKRNLPATIFHLVEQYGSLLVRVVQVRSTNDERSQIEHHEGVLLIEEVLDVVLPCAGGRWSVKRC